MNRVDDPEPFRILFVCTGNICRSPFAERVARRLLADHLGDEGAGRFVISSAGTQAVVGSGMDLLTRVEVRAWGGDLDGFVARQVGDADIAAADLVLTAELAHRAFVVRQVPRALRTAFTLREFVRLITAGRPGRLLADDPVARARQVVAAARATRGTLERVPREDNEVPDPHGLPVEVYRESAALIAAALHDIVKLMLAGATP